MLIKIDRGNMLNGVIHELCTVEFKIFSNNFIPDEFTEISGVEPSISGIAGTSFLMPIFGKVKSHKTTINAKVNYWQLTSGTLESEKQDLEEGLNFILLQMKPRIKEIHKFIKSKKLTPSLTLKALAYNQYLSINFTLEHIRILNLLLCEMETVFHPR
jgi:Domain of unknown function (DUF4279)